MNWIEKITELLNTHFKGELRWEDKLLVKSSPHNEIARIYGAAVNSTGGLMLLSNDGEWYLLEETDRNFNYVAPSVFQRVKILSLNL